MDEDEFSFGPSSLSLKDEGFAGFGNDHFGFGQFPIELELEPLDSRSIAMHKNDFLRAQGNRIP